MFALFRSKEPLLAPDDPVEIRTAIEIACPAMDIYALLDFGDERNQWRARGNPIKRQQGEPPVYRLWYDLVPEHSFLLTVTEAVLHRCYAFSASIIPPIGRRLASHERYTIAPLTGGGCTVTLVNVIEHMPGLTEIELDEEIGRSTHASASGLIKLKLQAEQGVEAVEAYERERGQREG